MRGVLHRVASCLRGKGEIVLLSSVNEGPINGSILYCVVHDIDTLKMLRYGHTCVLHVG